MLAVDPATGAMYSLPDNVNPTLEPQGSVGAVEQAHLQIVSTTTLSPEQMRGAVMVASPN